MNDDLRARLDLTLGAAFRVERELGGGGMSRVFLARDAALDRQVVVKVLDLQNAVASSAERFRLEIRTIAMLQHPHIVPVLTAGGDDTLLWYAMPFVSGESLRARLLREGALPVADAVLITRETLDALATAHARGIVHRDIKPENILLEGRHAMVADFGIAKALADAVVGTGLTTAGMSLGTPAYMAPEQALGESTTNHRADLYAVGVVLYEMLVGAPPFTGNVQSVIAAHLTAPVPSLRDRRSDLPPQLPALVERLMAKQPAERPQSAIEALASLEAMMTPTDLRSSAARASMDAAAADRAPTPSAKGDVSSSILPASAVAPARHRRRTAFVVGIAATALLAAAAFWSQRSGNTRQFDANADIIAVTPIGSTGDSTLARLGRDLVVTVSTNLDGVGALRAVDPMSVLQRARTLPSPITREDALALGRTVGAKSVLHGSIVPDGNDVRLDLNLLAVEGGASLARMSVRGAASDVRALTDSISAQLLRQVWRRGTPPAPYLADVATASTEALRAYLEGEQAFGKMDAEVALDAYERAAAADSNFVLPWMRIVQVRSTYVMPPDAAANGRLDSLESRLPTRERELRAVRRAPYDSWYERLDAYKAFSARYPDFHTAQYVTGDEIIHRGPLYGVAMREALPYVDRLDELAPTHADNAFHRLIVATAIADTTLTRVAARQLRERMGVQSGAFFTPVLDDVERTTPLSATHIAQTLQPAAEFARLSPAMTLYFFDKTSGSVAARDSAFTIVSRQGQFAAVRPDIELSQAIVRYSRGDVKSALDLLGTMAVTRTAGISVPVLAAELGATAAWIGNLDASAAEAALQRARGADTTRAGRLALTWVDGLLGIVSADSARLRRAMTALVDTGSTPRRLQRSLLGLWRARSTGQVDSLLAFEDEEMRAGRVISYATPLHRLEVGRALTKQGAPDRAERYLQWTDAAPTGGGLLVAQRTLGAMTAYERGIAAEQAKNPREAIRHFTNVVLTVDRPTMGLTSMVEDASRRLERLRAAGR